MIVSKKTHLVKPDRCPPAACSFRAVLHADKTPAVIWAEGLQAAREGAAATTDVHPRVGRAAYLGERADAGAVAVTIWLAAIAPS